MCLDKAVPNFIFKLDTSPLIKVEIDGVCRNLISHALKSRTLVFMATGTYGLAPLHHFNTSCQTRFSLASVSYPAVHVEPDPCE